MNAPQPAAHPGTITFVDDGRETVEPAEQVPDDVRFAPDAQGALVPVIKIIATTAGPRRVIRQYGVDGFELRATVQLLDSSKR